MGPSLCDGGKNALLWKNGTGNRHDSFLKARRRACSRARVLTDHPVVDSSCVLARNMLSNPARPISSGFPTNQSRLALQLGASGVWPLLASRYFTLVVLTLALPFICLAGRPLFGDVWWVIASGRELVQQGQLLQADPFTFAPHTAAYFDAQWLAQFLYFCSYRLLGLGGVSLFNATAVSVTFGILLALAWERTRNMAAATVSVLLAELTALWFLHPRAQTLSFTTFAATWWLLSRRRLQLHTLLALGTVQAVWANLHGSFFLGPVLTILLLGGEVSEAALQGQLRSVLRNGRVRLLLLALAAQAVGTLVTPYGPGIYTYVLKLSVDPTIRDHIAEWVPTTAADFPGAEFFASVALTLAIIGLARSRVAMKDLLMLGLFAVLGVQAYRNIPWWALVNAPILVVYLARLQLPTRLAGIARYFVTSKRPLRGNLIRAALLGFVLIGALPWAKAANPWLSDEQRGMVSGEYPEAAAAYLASHSYGPHVFADHAWSSYLDWRTWPAYQPMMDPSIEVHPAYVWNDIMTLNQGHVSWEELADRYGVDVLLLRPETQPLLISAAERSPRWQAVYRDNQSVIFVRSTELETQS